MPRFRRTTPVALSAVILASAVGLYGAATLGVREDGSPAASAAGAGERPAAASAQPSPVAPGETAGQARSPLGDAEFNGIQAGPGPQAPDTWHGDAGHYEYFRSWEGELTVWDGSRPQIVPGPGGNWFPAGQPGCGAGAYVVSFRSAGGGELTAQLRDALGGVTRESGRAEGWMLLDDCHLPHLQMPDQPGGPASSGIVYTVDEYHRVSR